ncbi:MAG: type III pantothenate kinase [Flavobacteriaceae bacterium]|nr:type III pantothenate kinase [Flavobacteriaceae bacterium]
MNLVIDVGNSFFKIAVFDSFDLIVKYDLSKFDKIDIYEIINNYPINSSIISNVSQIDNDILNYLNIKTNLFLLTHKLKLPFKNLYKTKKTLGQDRLGLISSSCFEFPNENVLVIDAGSCITFDFKNHKNEYLGGSISPGISMRFKSLNSFTTNLPLVSIDNFDNLFGNDTKSSIQSGVINGVVSEIEGVIDKYNVMFENIKIILTGGDTKFLLKRIKNTIFADQNFLLKGLNNLLQVNKKK